MRPVKQYFAANLLFLSAVLLLGACAQQEPRDGDNGEATAKAEPQCQVIERTGRRTGLRVCNRG